MGQMTILFAYSDGRGHKYASTSFLAGSLSDLPAALSATELLVAVVISD